MGGKAIVMHSELCIDINDKATVIIISSLNNIVFFAAAQSPETKPAYM